MDKEKLLELEIEATELEAIEDALEEKQIDLENRIDAAEENGNIERKEQLTEELRKVEELLQQAKIEKTTAESEPKETIDAVIPTAIEETEDYIIPISLEKTEEIKKKEKSKVQDGEEKAHEAELKAKAAQIRKKAVQEEKAREKEEEKANKEKDSLMESKDEYRKSFNQGIMDFAASKFEEAFAQIKKVADAGEKSGLSEEDLGQAEQLLGRMYKDGKGTRVDQERAWFWFKKATEHKNVEGYLAMGQHYTELSPKSPKEESDFRENALHYFELAGKAENKVGKEKFVDICIKKNNQISSSDAKKARNFLDELIELEEDAYLRQMLIDKKKELRRKKKKVKSNSYYARFRFEDIFAVIGSVCFAYGVILFMNYYLSWVDTLINFNYLVPEYFHSKDNLIGYYISNMAPILNNLSDETNYAEQWGFLFVVVGAFFSGLSPFEERGKKTNLVSEVLLYSSVIVSVVGVYYHSSGYKLIGGFQGGVSSKYILYVLYVFICAFVARLLAHLVQKFVLKIRGGL
ncbi:MAG: hypothetical protein K6G30_09065 [Acetatifactor sp.]|nr:hypothetical protein [Acetatifactor sp.]